MCESPENVVAAGGCASGLWKMTGYVHMGRASFSSFLKTIADEDMFAELVRCGLKTSQHVCMLRTLDM